MTGELSMGKLGNRNWRRHHLASSPELKRNTVPRRSISELLQASSNPFDAWKGLEDGVKAAGCPPICLQFRKRSVSLEYVIGRGLFDFERPS